MNILFIVSLLIRLGALENQNLSFWTEQLNSASSDLRINALAKLAELRSFESIGEISKLLAATDPEVRFHAARALGKLPNEQALQVLVGRKDQEKDAYVRSEIGRSIRTLQGIFQKRPPTEPTESTDEELEGR